MSDTLSVRELYCPGHFGNEYEVAMGYELKNILSEARHWGFNRYSDWFDTIDLADYYARDHKFYNMPEAVWDRKFEHYAIARDEGFPLGLVITPNHVFSDQVTPDNEAVGGVHYFGQLVCPSKPGVVELIVENYRRLFGDFARRGLRLAAISCGAYDYGGCACPACQPWIVTFGKLVLAIHEVAREVFGPLDLDLWGWWWTDEDHRLFSDWADREAPGAFTGFAHHIKYGETGYAQRPTPTGAGQRAFVHIGYGERGGNADVYGHYGPTISPRRLETTLDYLREQGAEGFLAYSEGFFDDVNKAILAGVASGRYPDAQAVLEAYAERHFGNAAADWAAWLADIGDVTEADPADLRRRFDRLARVARPSWRLDHLAGKLEMLEADHAVRAAGGAWNPAALAAATRFVETKERTWRGAWGRGLGRHVFRFDWKVPEWYPEYMGHRRAGTTAGANPTET